MQYRLYSVRRRLVFSLDERLYICVTTSDFENPNEIPVVMKLLQ